MSDISGYLQLQNQRIEEALARLIPERHSAYQSLFEAARYALLDGGKRLRPILTLAVVEMMEGDCQYALQPACALEIVHTYSLIHDDLPCMDNDDFRRGKPTVHKKYSEGHAVLTGDYLLTYAFEILASAPGLSDEKKIKLISLLAKRIGSDGMIGGQVMDIASVGANMNLETLRLLHRNKTGALITVAMEFGGILADADQRQMESLRRFGENIGLAFQIIDDILDVTSSRTKHGRQTASDVINGKSTYVTLLGIDRSKAYAAECYHQSLDALKPFPRRAPLVGLADFIIHREH
jgi:geranylgeranyl diphosphate synthase type II